MKDLEKRARASGAGGVIEVAFEVRVVVSGVGVLTMEQLEGS